jgi:hypothetical protein
VRVVHHRRLARAARRGQASAVSVAILTAAVLALALALYGYFTGHASRAYAEEALVNVYSDYSQAILVHLEASYINTSTPVRTGCYIVSINNMAGSPLTIYLTVLPASPGTQGLPSLDPAIARIPVDTLDDNESRVFIYGFWDANGDGIVDVVARNGSAFPGNPWLPTCDQLYEMSYGEKASTTLSYLTVQPSKVMVSLQGTSLSDLTEAQGVSLPYLPLWNVTLKPNGKISLFIYTEQYGDPQSLSLAVFFQFTDKYYLVSLTNLPVTNP